MISENPVMFDEQLLADAENAKEFVFDASVKKANNFWCSSTFCIPCTKQVSQSERNIQKRSEPKTKVIRASNIESKDDNQNKTTMNEQFPVHNFRHERLFKTEGNEKVKEEYKVKEQDFRNSYEQPKGKCYGQVIECIVILGNDKIHLLMNDYEDTKSQDRRKLSQKGKRSPKKFDSHQKLTNYHYNLPVPSKRESLVNRELDSDKDIAVYRATENRAETYSISNRSNNSSILENIIGFKKDVGGDFKGSSFKNREIRLPQNNFIGTSASREPKFSKSFQKIDDSLEDDLLSYQADSNQRKRGSRKGPGGMAFTWNLYA